MHVRMNKFTYTYMHMQLRTYSVSTQFNIPVAVTSLLITCTVSVNDDGLLSVSCKCTMPSSSLTEYNSEMKLTVISNRRK